MICCHRYVNIKKKSYKINFYECKKKVFISSVCLFYIKLHEVYWLSPGVDTRLENDQLIGSNVQTLTVHSRGIWREVYGAESQLKLANEPNRKFWQEQTLTMNLTNWECIPSSFKSIPLTTGCTYYGEIIWFWSRIVINRLFYTWTNNDQNKQQPDRTLLAKTRFS